RSRHRRPGEGSARTAPRQADALHDGRAAETAPFEIAFCRLPPGSPMKAALSFLVVALVGLVLWVRHTSTRPTEAHRAIIAGLKEELAAAAREQAALRSELSQAKA